MCLRGAAGLGVPGLSCHLKNSAGQQGGALSVEAWRWWCLCAAWFRIALVDWDMEFRFPACGTRGTASISVELSLGTGDRLGHHETGFKAHGKEWYKLAVQARACNLSTWGAEAGRSKVPAQLGILMRSWIKTKTNKQNPWNVSCCEGPGFSPQHSKTSFTRCGDTGHLGPHQSGRLRKKSQSSGPEGAI